MDIKQRLRQLESQLVGECGFVSEDVDVLRAAVAEIERLETDLAEEVRKLRDANAAISNLIADREPYDLNEM